MAKILIIDDDGVVRDALHLFLERDGHKVLAAADGAAGAKAFKAEAPDLVVLDKDVPSLAGLEVLRKIRAQSSAVPVVVLTARDSAREAGPYQSSGASAFLSKKDGLVGVLNEIDRLLSPARPVLPPPPPFSRPALPPPAILPVTGRPRGLVMVVDDDAAILDTVGRFLASYGYEVLQYADGLSAMEAAVARPPAAIVLDISMPGKDGVAVLKELLPKLKGTGFIMLSGTGDETVAQACLKLGAYDYLTKPANLGSLETIVRACVAASGRA
jgi:DNA-binding response OmpR family regulator